MPKKLTGNSSRSYRKAAIELPIGGHCRVNGSLIVCMEGQECSDCLFGHKEVCDTEGFRMLCHDYERSDKRSVWFKEIRG